MKQGLLAVFLCAVLVSCSDPNPLLGEWRVSAGPDTIAQTIKFTDSQSISDTSSGTASDNVNYQIQPDKVIVTSSLGFDLVYTLVDANTIQVTLPGSGVVTYTKISE